MADERIEVEWIATAQQMVGVLDKISGKLDKQEKELQKIGTSSKKAAEMAAGSFNKLEQELKEAEAAMKGMAIGTKAFEAQRLKVDALRNSLAKAKGEINQIGANVGGQLNSGLGKLRSFAMGFVGLQQAIEVIVGELEKAQRLQFEAAGATRTVEQAIARMAPNIGAENVGRAREMVAANAPSLGVTQEGLAGMLGDAISAGAADLDEAMMLAAKTLKLTAGSAQDAAPMMSGMLTLAAQTGNRNWDELIGQFSQFQEAGRGENMTTSIRNMATAMAAANIKGERLAPLGGERTLEMGAAISQLLQDPQMDITGTALRSLFQKMDSFVPEVKATLDDKTKSVIPRDAVEAFKKLGTLDERIAAMQANPELAKQFLSRIEDNQVKPAIRAIVTGDARAKNLIAKAEEIVQAGPQAEKAGQALSSVITQMTPALRAENRAEANIQAMQTGGTEGLEGQATRVVSRTLESVDLSGIDEFRKLEANIAMKTAEDKAGKGIEILEGLQNKTQVLGVPLGGELTDEHRSLLKQQIEILRELQKDIAAQRNPPPVNVRMAPAPPQPQRPQNAPLPVATVP